MLPKSIMSFRYLAKVSFFIIFSLPIFFSSQMHAAVYLMPPPGEDVIGQLFTMGVKRGDTVEKIRMRYEISYHELVEANPYVNFRRLKAGETLIIPTQHILPRYRSGIVLNMAELRLYYFPLGGRYVYTFTVGMGRPNWRTPTTITKVVKKEIDPIWHVPKSIQAYMWEKHNIWLPENVPPGPKNPLGKYALYLAKNGYLIHGTNQPESVGTYASSGCMRLLSDPIAMLYEDVEIGTPVYILHHANKAGWLHGKLYLEAHVPVRLHRAEDELNHLDIDDVIENAVKFRSALIDWQKVHEVANSRDGVPHIIGVAIK